MKALFLAICLVCTTNLARANRDVDVTIRPGPSSCSTVCSPIGQCTTICN